MKRYFLISAVLFFCLSGCKKDTDKPLDITGIWNLINIDLPTKAAIVDDETIDVYIEFRSDKSFSMYQQLGAGSFRSYTGTWSLGGSTLSGTYSDKSAWSTSYEVSVDSGTMTMSSSGETYTYRKVDRIPDGIIVY
ncbi:MAG: lipocalin family protein [Bacteroidales bacterium]|nr:lipocalin family protein [Bacteroidales bacterium]